MNKLKLYVSGAPTHFQLSNKYEILASFEPAEIDLMIIFSNGAFEQGYEMAVALEKYSKPVLVLSKSSEPLDIDHPMYTFAKYLDISEANNLIEQKVKKHFPQIEVNVCATDICTV